MIKSYNIAMNSRFHELRFETMFLTCIFSEAECIDGINTQSFTFIDQIKVIRGSIKDPFDWM